MNLLRLFALICALVCAAGLSAQVVISGFTQTGSLAANDDDHSGNHSVNGVGELLGFEISFGGTNYTRTFISNNGYITFGSGSGDYTPVPFNTNYTGLPIIAAFYSDVDTRWAGSGIVTWGTATVDGRAAFVAKWDKVGEYAAASFSPNTFSLILVSRADLGAGNFDVFFNYGSMNWDHSSSNEFGAVVGFHNGNATTPLFYQVPGSGTPGAFLDGGANSLASATNTGSAGGILLQSLSSATPTIATITAVPEPSTYALMALGLGLVGLMLRRRAA